MPMLKNDVSALKEWEIIRIKADLLCMGLRPTKTAEIIYRRQNPCQDWKTGNVGVHFAFGSESHVLATVTHSFDQLSPYSIEEFDRVLVLLRENSIVANIKEVPMPHWYYKKVSTDVPMPTYFLHEGKKFLHQAYTGCDYHSIGLQCGFCSTGSKWKIGTPIEVAETVDEACKENNTYQVCLGGGTKIPIKHNIEYFSKCASEISKRHPYVPIWVEMNPPETDDDIDTLIKSGVTSFGFNIEIWDDTLRQEICPGKSKISKKRYIDAMKYALSVVGSNRVGSVLLAGIEPVAIPQKT
jgi:hypothetical protein